MRPAPPPGPPSGPASSSGAATPARRAGRSAAPAGTTAPLLPSRRALAPLRQLCRTAERDGLQPGALVLEPLLELRRAADEKPFEQVAPVEVERIGQSAHLGRARELDHVAAVSLGVEADVLVTSGHEHAVTERMPEPVQCLAQRRAGVLLIELGPE